MRMTGGNDISRRGFLQGLSAVVLTPARLVARPAAAEPAGLIDRSASEAVARMIRGELTAERYAGALLARCESLRSLNAFISFDPARVLEAARNSDRFRSSGGRPGALFGLPMPIKDSVNTRDYPTTAGTPALRRFQPADDAPVMKSLRDAGAIVLGKTNLHELSYGWTSNNLAFGAVHNPYAPGRIPGGSSGGTGAAVASRMAPLGLAEDTEGSIRVPAAMCGLSGFRPTTGRYPTQGCAPISPLFDQVGPLARSVADLMLFDSVAAREPAHLPPRSAKRPSASLPLQGVRLGLIDYGYAGLDEKLEHVIEQALQRLKQAGAQIIRGEMPGLQALIDKTTDPVQNHDVRIYLAKYLKDYHAGVSFDEVVARASPDIQALFKTDVLPGGVNFVTEEMYAAARDIHLPALRRLYRDYFARSGVSAIVFPTTLTPPPRIGEEDTLLIRGAKVPFATAVSRNIAPGSTAGLPGLVLPAGLTSDGLPVGIEFDGPAGTDLELLEIGLGLEQALGPLPAPR